MQVIQQSRGIIRILSCHNRHVLWTRNATRRSTTSFSLSTTTTIFANNFHRRFSAMSSSEGENFDLDNVSGSEDSEDYAPVVKKVRSKF